LDFGFLTLFFCSSVSTCFSTTTSSAPPFAGFLAPPFAALALASSSSFRLRSSSSALSLAASSASFCFLSFLRQPFWLLLQLFFFFFGHFTMNNRGSSDSFFFFRFFIKFVKLLYKLSLLLFEGSDFFVEELLSLFNEFDHILVTSIVNCVK